MIIEHDMTVDELIAKIKEGEKYFYRIDFGEKEVSNEIFDNVVFEECILSVDFSDSTFRNTRFLNSNIKCSTFLDSDLSNMVIENCSVESVVFEKSVMDGVVFNKNYCYGKILNQDELNQFIGLIAR